MPNKGAMFVWTDDPAGTRTGIVVRDTGSSVTYSLTAPLPTGINARRGVATTYDGSRVHIVMGSNAVRDDGASYDVDANSWSAIAPSALAAQCPGWHGATPTAYAAGAVHAFGGYRAGGGDFCRSADVFSYDVSGGAWLNGAALPNGHFRLQHTWLSVGARVLLVGGFGDANFEYQEAWLFDPSNRTATGWNSVPIPPVPSPLPSSYPFAMYTGRAVIMYGGSYHGGGHLSGGTLGIVSAAGVSWSVLPTSGAPGARQAFLPDTAGNTQSVWSGSEAIIWGGYNGDLQLNGARYQPPVGCVCPMNADAPTWMQSPCTGVPTTGLPACTP